MPRSDYKVLFRIDENSGTPYAVFPDHINRHHPNPWMLACYSHMMMECWLHEDWYWTQTRRAQPAEYAELLAEVYLLPESQNHKLRILKHMPGKQAWLMHREDAEFERAWRSA